MAKIFGFILARGGSKRVIKKNIRNFHGRPMISYAIDNALNSKVFDRLIVSTDCQETAQISRKYGAEVPELRNSELSGDNVPTIDVMASLIEQFELEGQDLVCCIYGTNPFLTPQNLQSAMELLKSGPRKQINYVSTITEYSFPPQRSLKQTSGDCYEMANLDFVMSRSQDLEKRFHECAQFWWAFAETWRAKIPMQTGLRGMILPRWHQQDIDTEEDWKEAELKYAALHLNLEFRLSSND